jgi:membrane protein
VEVPATVTQQVDRLQALVAWWESTRLGRAVTQFSAVQASTLAGGIAYAGMFSLAAGLTLLFSIFAGLLGSRPGWQETLTETINQYFPNLIATSSTSNDGLISIDQLINSSLTNWAGLIAGVVLLYSSLRLMSAFQGAIQLTFGMTRHPSRNFLVSKVWALVGFLGLGVAVVVASGLDITTASIGHWLENYWSGGGHWLVEAGGYVVSLLIQTVVVVALIRIVAGARPPRRDLWLGAMAAGVAMSAARFFAAVLVRSASSNPALASFAALIAILIWVDVLALIILLASAWIAQAGQSHGPHDQADSSTENSNSLKENSDLLADSSDPDSSESPTATDDSPTETADSHEKTADPPTGSLNSPTTTAKTPTSSPTHLTTTT